MAILAQLVDDVVVHKFELNGDTVTIGRHTDNDIVINDSAVSAHHARLHLRKNPDFDDYREIYIEDLRSTNGTFVNEIRLSQPQQLHHDDVVRLAWNQFKLNDLKTEEMGQTRHMIQGEPSS